MGIQKLISEIIAYGSVFALGYWVGGGCEYQKLAENNPDPYNETKIEKRIDDKSKINELEKRLERLENENKPYRR